jgi:hypothetical protein
MKAMSISVLERLYPRIQFFQLLHARVSQSTQARECADLLPGRRKEALCWVPIERKRESSL